MSMGINNNYSNYVNSYANAATQKTRQNSQIGKIEATQEDYIKKLRNCSEPLRVRSQLLCKTENRKIFFCSDLLLLCG